jgi:tetratricopeptide (TPR) repeat protein
MSTAESYEKAKDFGRDEKPDTILFEDEFLTADSLIPLKKDAAERSLKQTLGEIEELIREKKWEDMIAVFHPVEEKLPELLIHEKDVRIREKAAFALGQLKRFDEAIGELNKCILKEPDNFFHHSAMAYTAYNSLYAAKNREIFLTGKAKNDRIKLAHKHFNVTQTLRPEGVTNYYRQAMLFKQLENKPEKAMPLFSKAIGNWDELTEDDKQTRHQERKNFIKSLYQHASTLLKKGRAKAALAEIKRCLTEDEKSNHVSLVFKYFALGKVNYHLNHFEQARDALLFSIQCRSGNSIDFVYELLARTYLALGKTDRALKTIGMVPEKWRRPYYRWTEADTLCAVKDFEGAKKVLLSCQERDNRSRHKALIRLAKIEYLLQHFQSAMEYAAKADAFFVEKWGNRFADGLFWQSICAHRMGDTSEACRLADELGEHSPNYAGLEKLRVTIGG